MTIEMRRLTPGTSSDREPLPPRILVVGDVMLDLYTWGAADRVSPESPVLVLRAEREEARLGGAGAVASLSAALDTRPIVAGVVGTDAAAHVVRRLVTELIPADSDQPALLTAGDRPTTVKERLIGQTASRHGQQMLRVDRELCQALPDLLADELGAAAMAALDDVRAVLVSDYGKGVCSPRLLRELMRAAADRNLPVLVDPRRDGDYEVYRGATLIKPNRHQAGQATGRRIHSREEALAAGRELCERYDFRAAVITLDADGMVLVTAEGSPPLPSGEGRGEGGRNFTSGHHATSANATCVENHFAARDREVADVTGAGDTVLAVLGATLARGFDLARACELATAAAALQVERLGVAPILWRELPLRPEESECSRIRENSGRNVTPPDFSRSRLHVPGSRIVTLDELLPLVGPAARGARTIVFTNGCFDLLHAGHIHCLTTAKALGDVLVVGINSDASVHRLKGPSRPIVGQAHRATMLAALACVDHVVIFDDDTPERVIAELRPDVLVKGAERRPGPIPGESIVASYGGRIEFVPALPGMSTTTLVERIV